MNDRFCQVCKQTFDGYTYTIELNDDRNKVLITGHQKCIDELFDEIKSLKDYKKKPINKILKEINFELS